MVSPDPQLSLRLEVLTASIGRLVEIVDSLGADAQQQLGLHESPRYAVANIARLLVYRATVRLE